LKEFDQSKRNKNFSKRRPKSKTNNNYRGRSEQHISQQQQQSQSVTTNKQIIASCVDQQHELIIITI